MTRLALLAGTVPVPPHPAPSLLEGTSKLLPDAIACLWLYRPRPFRRRPISPALDSEMRPGSLGFRWKKVFPWARAIEPLALQTPQAPGTGTRAALASL